MQGNEPKPNHLEDVPDAEIVERPGGISFVWILPVVAALVGGWLLYKAYSEKGPEVLIEFRSAQSLIEGKTTVRYRDVQVGVVKEIHFSNDLSRVRVRAELNTDITSHLTENTRFWVVRPRVAATEVSGLETLLSGAYIAMDPSAEGEERRSFIGLEEPPVLTLDEDGTEFLLVADELGGLAVGSVVYFRHFPVGQVVASGLAEGNRQVELRVFVRAPFDREIRRDTRFWRLSGIHFEATADGVDFRVESIATLLAGGITFETPDGFERSAPAKPGELFTLYSTKAATLEPAMTAWTPYVLYFEDSIRGLKVGVPVEFQGIRIGTVQDIALEVEAKDENVRIPVLIHLQPDRVKLADEDVPRTDQERRERSRGIVETLVARGMRAQLQPGNFLTGQLYVSLGFVPNPEPAKVTYDGPYPSIPTAPGALGSIMADVSSLVARLNRLPLEQIGRDLQLTVARARTIAEAPEIWDTLVELRALSGEARSALREIDAELVPALKNLRAGSVEANKLMADARRAIDQADATLGSFEGVTDRKREFGSQLYKALTELAAAAQAIRVMAEYLERHPEALISGKR